LSFHLKKLRSAHLLREEAAGRTKRLFVEDPERVATVLVTYRRSFLDEAIDRFTEAWLALAAPEIPIARQDVAPGNGAQEAKHAEVDVDSSDADVKQAPAEPASADAPNAAHDGAKAKAKP
jgi:hypothetical protein